MQPYLDTRFLGTLLIRSPAYDLAWLLLRRRFEPPFLVTAFEALRIEHMFLHQTDDTLKLAALRGHQEWQRHLQEGIFQLASLDWEAAQRLAIDLNRRSLDHRISPMHYYEAASASLLQVSHFVSLEPHARAAASMAGLRLLPQKLNR